MNWYKKTFIKNSRQSHEHEFSYYGIKFIGEISGKYRPATQIDPPEYPEVEITSAEIEDYEELIEVFGDDDVKKINDYITAEVNLRTSHFGVNNEPFIIKFNGLTLTIKVPTESQISNTYITNWIMVGARIDNPNVFLKSIPENIIERVETGMLENYLEGSWSEEV